MFVCQQMWPSEQLKRAYFLGVIVLSCYTVPLLLITVLYSLIGYRVWHRDAPGFANTSDVTTLTYLLCMCSQARRQEMKGSVFFCKKSGKWGFLEKKEKWGCFFCKKVDLSSTQGCIMYSISIFFILHFTYLRGCVRACARITHRVTLTQFRSISMPAGFRRHLVGKTLRNDRYSAVT